MVRWASVAPILGPPIQHLLEPLRSRPFLHDTELVQWNSSTTTAGIRIEMVSTVATTDETE